MRTIIINLFARPGSSWLLAAVVFLLPAAGSAATHEYRIAVDADLSLLTVEARFSNPVRVIWGQSDDARRYLDNARSCSGGKQFSPRGRRLRLAKGGINCLTYEVDLRAAARSARNRMSLSARTLVVSPRLFMWQPSLRRNDQVRARFDLHDGIGVSVPWEPVGDAFAYGASPRSGSGIAVFGDFAAVTEHVAGADVRIVLLRSGRDIDLDPLVNWVRATAESVALAYGRFPNPDTRVVLIPVSGNPWDGDSAVPFGRVVRDGGETIELLIDDRRPVADYYHEWTPTHEFSHLMLPYVDRRQRWISEGFATYYQNLLLARAGQYSDEMAWQRLYEGLERGRESVPDLSPNAAAVNGVRNARMKVYWSGVSLALMADVELRSRSGGSESLDTVLDRLQRCCLPSGRSWSGPELFRQLDALLDEPLFMDLYRRYADAAGFPDARPLLHQLGVAFDDGTLKLSDDARLAHIRQTLTARPGRT